MLKSNTSPRLSICCSSQTLSCSHWTSTYSCNGLDRHHCCLCPSRQSCLFGLLGRSLEAAQDGSVAVRKGCRCLLVALSCCRAPAGLQEVRSSIGKLKARSWHVTRIYMARYGYFFFDMPRPPHSMLPLVLKQYGGRGRQRVVAEEEIERS